MFDEHFADLKPHPTTRYADFVVSDDLRFEAWFETHDFNAEQVRWARLIESRIKADALTIDGFWDYDFDEHPFRSLGGYNQAVRVFGGEAALDDLLGSLNIAVFGPEGGGTPKGAGEHRII